jgi:hypothetical protein
VYIKTEHLDLPGGIRENIMVKVVLEDTPDSQACLCLPDWCMDAKDSSEVLRKFV